MMRGAVLIGGPDGTGKSTVADLIAAEAERRGIKVTRAHFAPGILVARNGDGSRVPEPHAEPPRGIAGSLAKTALVFADFTIGWATKWRKAKRDGLLLVERGWHDQAVDPLRYRIDPRLVPVVRGLGRLLPRADVAAVLGGDAEAVVARKPELDAAEVDRQQRQWRELAPQAGRRSVVVDTVAQEPEASAKAVVAACEAGVRRWTRALVAPARLDLRVTPGPSAPAALGIYRASRTAARLAARASSIDARHAGLRTASAPIEGLDGLAALLGVERDSISVMRSHTPGRFVVGFARARRLEVVAKLGPAGDPDLEREADVLARLANVEVPVRVPALRWAGEWNAHAVVATDVIPHRNRPSRVTVDDAAKVATALTNGVAREPLVHGDLASFNFLDTPAGLALVDWERSRNERAPLFDLAHFVVQEGALVGRISPERAAALLTERDSPGWRHLVDVGADPTDAPALVASYLEATPAPQPAATVFRSRLQELLS